MPCPFNKKSFWVIVVLATTLTGCDKMFSAGRTAPVQKENSSSTTDNKFVPNSPAEPQPQQEDFKESKNSAEDIPKDVLAQVGNWSLTNDEFREWLKIFKKLNPDAEIDLKNIDQTKRILSDIVSLQLLTQEAERREISKKKGLVLAMDVARSNILVPELAAQIVDGLSVTEQEIQEYYDNNKNSLAAPAEWKVREIVVDSEDTAKEILVDLYKGADFEELAKGKSKSKSSWKKGDLGFKSAFDFSKMESVVRTLEKGDISGVFKGPDGYYLVKLEDKRGGDPKKLADVKDGIKTGILLMKQQQALKDFIDQLKEKNAIVVNEKLLQE